MPPLTFEDICRCGVICECGWDEYDEYDEDDEDDGDG